MKKFIAFFAALILVSAFVLAQEQKGIHEPGTGLEDSEIKEARQGTGQENAVQTEEQQQNMGEEQQLQERQQVMAEENSEEGAEPKLIMAQEKKREFKGLENALTNVKNEKAREVLQRNLERFEEKVQERLQRMENIEVEEVDEETGALKLKAEEPVRWFGLIKGKATKRFEIDSEGKVNERAPWYSFLYAEAKE